MTVKASVCILLFAKVPALGKVKTRLQPALGSHGALQAHCELTIYCIETLKASSLPFEMWWNREPDAALLDAASTRNGLTSGEATVADLKYALKHVPVQRVQQGSDLGERMASALAQVSLKYDRVIIVGADCPSIHGDYLSTAYQSLSKYDLVFGPAEDGGYVLVGCRAGIDSEMLHKAFANIAWGSSQVLRQNLLRVKALGLSSVCLAALWDVDDEADWRRFRLLKAKRLT